MDHAAVAHRATAEYIYPKSRNSLAVRLFTARGDVDEAALLWWERGETDPAERRETAIRPVLRDRWRDCHEAEIVTEHISAYIRYCFRLRSGSLELWYGPNGFRDTEPGMDEDFFEFLWPNPEDGFKAPDWSSGQVYYQLFPERFKNGDPSLTPEGADAWGAAPTRENFMGGDLRGIREKLPYIASLGATCLYITPVFEAPSNHKYDTVDYYRIDPHFGTEEDLSALASDAHALGIRVLLDGVFNHCGYWWPPFQDVVKNGEASGYRDWFFINSYPVTHETRTYDCVGHYKWMPKLNLANPELRRYFIEVGKHWLRVSGADGWRLDVADELPAVFWEEFSRELRLGDVYKRQGLVGDLEARGLGLCGQGEPSSGALPIRGLPADVQSPGQPRHAEVPHPLWRGRGKVPSRRGAADVFSRLPRGLLWRRAGHGGRERP